MIIKGSGIVPCRISFEEQIRFVISKPMSSDLLVFFRLLVCINSANFLRVAGDSFFDLPQESRRMHCILKTPAFNWDG